MTLILLRRNKTFLGNKVLSRVEFKSISTSQPRAIHPLITLFAKPISRIAGAVLGRSVRVWWKKLPQNQKDALKTQALRFRWLAIPSIALVTILPTYGYYSVSKKRLDSMLSDSKSINIKVLSLIIIPLQN